MSTVVRRRVDGWYRTAGGLRQASVRSRSTAAAVIVVALAMMLGAAALLLLLQRALITEVSDAAEGRVADVAGQVSTEGTAGLARDLVETTRASQLVQVLDPAGRVIAASSSRVGNTPMTDLRPPSGALMRAEVGEMPLIDDDHNYLIVAQGASYDGQTYTVVVASSVETQRQTVTTVAKYLVIGIPALLIVVGVAGWLMVGQALRPVERIRSRVQGIGTRDLTERVPVPPTRDEIARLAVTMNEMLDRLETGQATQRAFVADASHELRSPLATLTAALEVIEADTTGEAWRELRAVMGTETDRMRQLVEDLLLLAKADDTGIRMRQTDVDLDDLVAAEIQRLRSSMPELKVTGDVHPVRVVGDPARLSQVLRNLVDNAARAAHTSVHLTTAEKDGSAIITVEDDGDGIPEADRLRVFERFVRLDTSRSRASGGSGLGLSIAREITRAHDGTITLTSSSTGGTTAIVTLPNIG
ncbi:HAMP domain-containing histidine kinase [Kribbella jiaozuonensis]|uniref:histidine kinase n=2 Tax=Kribbella jiaozuonensis TaxID=2575441 RepID=A0A4U3LLV1_9ACTN|nr:HAMP domain-containing sensor histidine kinase [Kribbella jiaozuonensis]TKK76735.1 HAMP domain-containing histidine kinase [Kribbella jiaozuonensis]